MADLNQVMLRGRVADDPEIRTVGENETKMAKVTIATTVSIGGDKEVTEFNKCVAWSWVADDCEPLGKGDLVMAIGRLRTRSWEADGGRKYMTEVNLDNIACVRKARGEGAVASPLPPAAKANGSWPFVDKRNGVSWTKPAEDKCSHAQDSGKDLLAVWHDHNDPTKGGTSYELADGKWEPLADIPKDAHIPF